MKLLSFINPLRSEDRRSGCYFKMHELNLGTESFKFLYISAELIIDCIICLIIASPF